MSSKNIQTVNLKEIKNPEFLKDLNYKELNILASDIRNEILHITSVNGGHLSSNLGVVEATIALCRTFDFTKDKIIFDVGHQCYTYKILTGRKLDSLRKKDGISGFQKISESPYDCYEAGHSSTSISAAQGFAISRDLKKENYNVIAFIGDASIVSGLALEALNSVAYGKNKVIIVLNDNGMSISKPTGAVGRMFSRISSAAGYNQIKRTYQRWLLKTKCGTKLFNISRKFKNWIKRKLVPSNLFDSMGYTYIGPVNGHDIKAMEKAFKRIKNTQKSVVVHICTTKGKGYKKAENDNNGYWHGVTPFEIETGDPKNLHPGYNSWSHIYSDLTDKMMQEHQNAFLIDPATIKGSGLEIIFDKYKTRTLDVGIAEEHAFTLASGLSCNGAHPIISIYSTFMQRAYDEISHDLARLNLNATILVDRAGLTGADGETHQGIYDVAFLNSVPNVTITMASSIEEAQYLYEESFKNHGPFFIRIPRTIIKVEKNTQKLSIPYGKWLEIRHSSTQKLAIIGFGQYLRELSDIIEENNLDCSIINALYILPLDEDKINELTNYETIVIYDPYSIEEGFSDILSKALQKKNYHGKIDIHSINKQFIKQATINEQLEDLNLLPEQIYKAIK